MKQFKLLTLACLSAILLMFVSGCGKESTNVQLNKNKFKKASKTASAVSIGQVITLKGSNGMYVSGENGTKAMNCNRTTAQDWEKFTIVDAGGGKVALQSMGKYVSSENGTAPINCNRTSIQGWEAFDLINNSDGTVSFRGNNGRYISSENGNSSMTCNRTSIGGWEKFSTSSTSTPPPSGTWRQANLTNFTSYPDPNSDECINYNGCLWAGYFAFVDGKQSESWVQSHNIIAVHSKDADAYKLKTFRIRKGSLQIDAKVYDMCSDTDCNGCCSENCKETGFLIDMEKYTMQRFGSGDGIVEWTCLDCQ